MQIGPKIRVGGSVGKIGQGLKIGAGKVLSNPIAQGAIGAFLGPGAAAAAGGLGRALDTTNGGSGIGDLALGTAKGYGVGKVGQVAKGALGALGGGSSAGGAAGAASAASGLIPHNAEGGIDWGKLASGAAGGVGDFLTGNGGLNALGAAQGVNAAMLGKKSSDFANKAFDLQNDSYTQRAPLRALGMQRLTTPTAPNISGIQATTGANPFAPRPLGVR